MYHYQRQEYESALATVTELVTLIEQSSQPVVYFLLPAALSLIRALDGAIGIKRALPPKREGTASELVTTSLSTTLNKGIAMLFKFAEYQPIIRVAALRIKGAAVCNHVVEEEEEDLELGLEYLRNAYELAEQLYMRSAAKRAMTSLSLYASSESPATPASD